jgi:hypothetical protein
MEKDGKKCGKIDGRYECLEEWRERRGVGRK